MVDLRPKRFRVTGRDGNGDLHAFETDDRQRAKETLTMFKKTFREAAQETQRWI